MKKLLLILAVIVLVLPAAACADVNISDFSDEELKYLICISAAELRAREATPEGWILLFEHEGVKIYQTGEPEISMGYLDVPAAFVNETDTGVIVKPDKALCNGWEIYSDGESVSANAKKKGDLTFKVRDAFVESVDQVTSITFSWYIIYETDPLSSWRQEKPEDHVFW